MAGFFVSGIGTEVGKTVASSVLVSALNADYWKPVQSGDLHHTDSQKLAEWAGPYVGQIHPEAHRFELAASPHRAAAAEDVEIKLSDFKLPASKGNLIVEGAGGLLVPLNKQDSMLDLIGHLGLPTLLVSRHYLGSINHTLLSIRALRQASIPIAGLIYVGPAKPSTQNIVADMTGLKPLFRIPEWPAVSAHRIQDFAKKLDLSSLS